MSMQRVALACCLAMAALCLGAARAAEFQAEWDKPKFCKQSDCPRFEVESRTNEYETRRYAPAVWAWVEVHDVNEHEEEAMEAFAELFQYFAGNNKENVTMPMTVPVAYNFMAEDEPERKNHEHKHKHTHHKKGLKHKEDKAHKHKSEKLRKHKSEKLHKHKSEKAHKHKKEQQPWGAELSQALGWHKRGARSHPRPPKVDIRMAFYLPYDYQEGKAPPPKPLSDVIVVDCLPEWTAHVRSFDGFPTRRRVMKHFEALHDALEEDDEEAPPRRCGVIAVYDPPTQLEDRHNEILINAGPECEGSGKSKAKKTAASLHWWDRVYGGLDRFALGA